MRYRAEFDMPDNDCSFCPCFARESNDTASCMLSYVRGEPCAMDGILVPDGRRNVVVTFPIPCDCPLEVCTTKREI